MAIQLANFTPQVNRGSMVDLPPVDDFSESVVKGYQAGRIFAGIPQQLDELKIAQQQQEFDQNSQMFPEKLKLVQQENLNQPVNRELAIGKFLGDPSTVTNMDTGPVVPVGNSHMALTQQFAAPNANRTIPGAISEQVPSDTREINIPGYPGVGVSPTVGKNFELQKRNEEDERWFKRRDYMVANPIGGGTTGSEKQELAALMESLSPEDQLKVLTLNNSFKSRLAGNPQAMISVARAIKNGATLDDAQDFLLKSTNPALVNDKDVFAAFNQATVKLPTAKKAEVATALDNFLQPSSPSYDPPEAMQLLKNTVRAGLDEGERKQLTSSTGLVQRMSQVKQAIAALPADVKTNLFTGTAEQIAQKLGETGTPELAELAVMIQFGMQRYVNEITGVAFTPQEFDRYKTIFPAITKGGALNESLINSILKASANDAHSKYASVFGEGAYKSLRNRFQQEHGFIDELSNFPFKGVNDKDTGPQTSRTPIEKKKSNPTSYDDFRNYMKSKGK